MSNLPSIPPRGPGFQIGAPMEINAVHQPPKFRLKKYVFFLRKFWWIPLITLVLAMVVAGTNFLVAPPEFVSVTSMWETERLQLPDGASFAENQDTYFGTMTAVLQSDTLRQLALTRMTIGGTNTIAMDKDGNPLDVSITVSQGVRSSVYFVEAVSANPAFTPAYLNALVNSYLDYKRDVRKDVSGGTLASISAQISGLQQQMKADEDALDQ